MTMSLYFLDGADDLPWVDVDDWPIILEDALDCEVTAEGHVVTFTRTNGYTMALDFEQDTITFDDFDGFLQSDNASTLLDLLSMNTENEAGESALFQKNADFSFDRYGDELVLNLADYGIELVEQDGQYLVPMQTLVDFTMGVKLGVGMFFNGQRIFVSQGNDLKESGYYDAPAGECSEALCKYGYGELCMMQPNRDVIDYVTARAVRPFEIQHTDPGYRYAETHVFDVGALEPELACPHSVKNVHTLQSVIARGDVKLDQGYIVSCTGGRTEDIAAAAQILKGRHIPPYTRLIVVPASNEVMQECIRLGHIQALMDAGATINAPGCAACLGVHAGILAPGEVCITSTNRNFPGRMGSKEASLYLASPATVAASILNGKITDPRAYL
ncbi:MAG: hypothetical protein IKE76_14905 [Clostridia bacterium]|nr:hypothetical protein [Clostridia bacterium]